MTYMKELQSRREPKTYGIVDFDVFTGSTSWEPGSIFSLHEVDPLVAGAMSVSEWLRGWRQRTDILNSDTDEVYEIKPLRSRDKGVEQLQGYLKALRALAPTTSPVFGPPRPRNWRGGTWDPSRYPLVIGGLGGQRTCVIHAWQDPQVQGLIVYDIKCCVRSEPQERPELRPTRVTYVVPEIEQEMRPVFEEMVRQTMPYGEAGSRYAVLASERFFELFVKGAWDRKLDAIHDRYGPRPGPVFRKFMLETTVLQHILSQGAGTFLIVASDYLPREQADRFLELTLTQWKIGVAAGTVGLVAAGAVPLAAEAAVGASWTTSVGLTPTLAAELATGTAVAGNVLPRVATNLPQVAPSLLNGSSRLLEVGVSAASRGVGAQALTRIGEQAGIGLGMLGAFLYVTLPADAAASPAGSPPTVAEVSGVELPLLAPVELLQPVGSNRIGAGSFVRCGGEKYFVPAIVTANAS
ncbi:hypothetical protein D7193_26375 [Micromonospora costi]|uniref:Uncharacterized protein n=1 Tax=Micromonospora costi TaxID=1530042 RepID=A0A3A9ZUX0_9ACTN|nr:hypothetical protein D7193_26375 [Micromonospora costi]